jgi:hypothetical protein
MEALSVGGEVPASTISGFSIISSFLPSSAIWIIGSCQTSPASANFFDRPGYKLSNHRSRFQQAVGQGETYIPLLSPNHLIFAC